jgi:hypothetical protein
MLQPLQSKTNLYNLNKELPKSIGEGIQPITQKSDFLKDNSSGLIQGASLLAGMAGTAIQGDDPVPKKGASALSGAAQGASMGMVLGPWGAAGGALIGGAAGLFSAGKAQQLDEDRRETEAIVERSGYEQNKFNYMPNLDV